MPDIHKVAFATDDGNNINRHFGRLRGYVVFTITDGQPTSREILARPDDVDRPTGGHNHTALLDPVSDCTTLVAGGMGQPMAAHAARTGLQLVLTSLTSIDVALERYLDGTLEHESNRAHTPRH
jgi:predicted Fe-Mo cluster-binding NifX family protein